MEPYYYIMSALVLALGTATAWLFRKGGIYRPNEEAPGAPDLPPKRPQDETLPPEPPIPAPEPENAPESVLKPPPKLNFSTPKTAYHSVRVLCDEAGLTLQEKNLLCAVIFQESRFDNRALNRNKDASGRVRSTDFGIAQINDYWHIGPLKTFPSVDYVLKNPDKVVQWMIRQYKAGRLHLWVAYSSGAYKQWLKPTSPMWLLKTNK